MDSEEYLNKAAVKYPGDFYASAISLKYLLPSVKTRPTVDKHPPIFYIVRWEEGYLLCAYDDILNPKTCDSTTKG